MFLLSYSIYLYADDAKIYKVINQITDHLHLQTVMNTVKTLSDEWLLRLNIDKCNAVSYCLKTPLDAPYHIIDGNMSYNLEKLNSINDLGVIFDSSLTFKDHIGPKNKESIQYIGYY